VQQRRQLARRVDERWGNISIPPTLQPNRVAK
jgi:hypothetical protein